MEALAQDGISAFPGILFLPPDAGRPVRKKISYLRVLKRKISYVDDLAKVIEILITFAIFYI